MATDGNLKQTGTSSRRTLFFIGGLALFLVFFISLFLPIFKPGWQDLKNSEISASKKQSPLKNLMAGIFGFVPQDQATENFLLLGASGQGYLAPDLTDTILAVRIAGDKIFLFSLPRDLLVKIPNSERWSKLNTLYALKKNDAGHEFDLIIKKTQEITGLEISHCGLVNLTLVKKLVDTLGGINVMVKEDIHDPGFPSVTNGYETFEIKSGWRYLDGETTLKYIRSRHSAQGDFDRIERQQQVLQALKQKVLDLDIWNLPAYWQVFENIVSETKTDLALFEIKDYWQKIKGVSAENTVKTDLEKSGLLTTGPAELGGETVSTVRPKAGLENYEDIKKYVEEIISK